MKVYRVINNVNYERIDGSSSSELADYARGKISIPSNAYSEGVNNHIYEKGKNYLHFFHFFEDAVDFSATCSGDFYISEYDIPKKILLEGIGFGIYEEHVHYIPILEYAIDYTKLDNSFITMRCVKYDSSLFSLVENPTGKYYNYVSGGYKKTLECFGVECSKNRPIDYILPNKKKVKSIPYVG